MFFQNIFFFWLAFLHVTVSKKLKIIGSTDADLVDYPYHASFRRLSDFRHICGGAIISHHHVITAAHCVTDDIMNAFKIKIFIGKSPIFNGVGSTILNISAIYCHPEYTATVSETAIFQNDIAIVKVLETIVFNQYQNKVQLPTRDLYSHDMGILTGWGTTTYPTLTFPDNLKRTWLTVIDNNMCSKYVPFNISIGQFCAFQKFGIGACVGDSGSPLVNVNAIIGIASFCRLCATGVPDIFTNVYHHLDFVNVILKNN